MCFPSRSEAGSWALNSCLSQSATEVLGHRPHLCTALLPLAWEGHCQAPWPSRSTQHTYGAMLLRASRHSCPCTQGPAPDTTVLLYDLSRWTRSYRGFTATDLEANVGVAVSLPLPCAEPHSVLLTLSLNPGLAQAWGWWCGRTLIRAQPRDCCQLSPTAGEWEPSAIPEKGKRSCFHDLGT